MNASSVRRFVIRHRSRRRIITDLFVIPLLVATLFGSVRLISQPSPRVHAVSPVFALSAEHPESIETMEYPGYFAFSSPIGYGTFPAIKQDPNFRRDTDSISVKYPTAKKIVRHNRLPKPSTDLPDLKTILAISPSPTHKSPGSIEKTFFAIEMDPLLSARGFAVPTKTLEASMPSNSPKGEIRLHVMLDANGIVKHVFFPAGNTLPWSEIRRIEREILKSTAAKASQSTLGWFQIRWERPADGKPEVQ